MAFHNAESGVSNHVIHAFEYANATARSIATGLTSADIGKVAKQTDTSQYFVLTSDSPATWAEITNGLPSLSLSCGTFTTSSSSYVDVTNLTVTLITSGRPVKLYLINDGTAGALSGTGTLLSGTASNFFNLFMIALRDVSTSCGEHVVASGVTVSSGSQSIATISLSSPVSTFLFYDTPSAGSHTYKIRVKGAFADTGVLTLSHARLVVEEY